MVLFEGNVCLCLLFLAPGLQVTTEPPLPICIYLWLKFIFTWLKTGCNNTTISKQCCGSKMNKCWYLFSMRASKWVSLSRTLFYKLHFEWTVYDVYVCGWYIARLEKLERSYKNKYWKQIFYNLSNWIETEVKILLAVHANSGTIYCLPAQELLSNNCSVIFEFLIFLDSKAISNHIFSFKSTFFSTPFKYSVSLNLFLVL